MISQPKRKRKNWSEDREEEMIRPDGIKNLIVPQRNINNQAWLERRELSGNIKSFLLSLDPTLFLTTSSSFLSKTREPSFHHPHSRSIIFNI